MRRDPMRWLLASRTHLAVGLLAIVAIAVGVVLAIPHQHREAMAPAPIASPTLRPPSPVAGPASGSETQPRTQVGDRVVRRFLGLYLGARSKRSMPPALQAVATPQLWQGLRLTDPGNIPAGRLLRLRATTPGDYAAEYTAELSDGSALLVEVVDDGDSWRVSNVQPTKGGSTNSA